MLIPVGNTYCKVKSPWRVFMGAAAGNGCEQWTPCNLSRTLQFAQATLSYEYTLLMDVYSWELITG